MSQSVVAAVAAVGLQTEGAYGQGDVVGDDEQPLLVDVLLVQPVAHCVAAEVHEGGGLEQKNLASLNRCLCHETITLILKNNIGRLSKSVQYHKTCIVSGILILSTGVTQTTNQKFVHSLSIKPERRQQRRQQPDGSS